MNERNNEKSKVKVSKKLQLTLNFKPEEILDIVCLEFEFKKLPNEVEKVIEYINNERIQYESMLKNDDKDVNSCCKIFYLEVFKIKKFYMRSNQQSYSHQMSNINKVNESLLFCRQFITKYGLLLEKDIRGKSLFLFYLLCEVYQSIEINDFSIIQEIEMKYKKNIILFCTTFDYTAISKNDRKSCTPSLIKFYTAQLIGTIGLIQYELRYYNNALENLDISIKTRLENIEERNILEKYLNTKLKVIEYQLVIYYLKSKKCSLLLKIGRFAECSSFGNQLKQKIKSIVDNLSSESKQTKAHSEIIKQFQNLYVKQLDIIEQSNNNARHMLLDTDINDLLNEMKGNDNDKLQNESQSEVLQTEDQIQSGNASDIKIENLQINKEQSNILQSMNQKKQSLNRISSLANIPYDPDFRNFLASRQDANYDSNKILQNIQSKQTSAALRDSDLQSYKTLMMKDSQTRKNLANDQLSINIINSVGKQSTKNDEKNTFKINQDSFGDLNSLSFLIKAQSDQSQVKQIQLQNKLSQSNKNLRSNSQYTFSAQPSQKEMNSSNQALQNDQQQQFLIQQNKLNSNHFLKTMSQYTFSAQTLQKEDTKIQQSVSSQKGITSSQLQQSVHEKEILDSKKLNQLKMENNQDKQIQNDKQIRKKKLRLSPSRVNITNFSYFFQSQDTNNQTSIRQILQNNKKKKNLNEKDTQQFISGICPTSVNTQQSVVQNQLTEVQQDGIQYYKTNNQEDKKQNQQYFDFNTAEKKQESIFNLYTLNTQQQEQIPFSERFQQDTEVNNQNFLFTETKATETNNNPLSEVQKKLTFSTPYIQSTTLNNLSNQDQYLQFNTLQSQQKTLITDQDNQISNTLKTETAPNINKPRKKYSKMTIEQFKPYEIRQLIDGSQTERPSQYNGQLSTQLSPPPPTQFQQRPEYYERPPDFMLNTQGSQSLQDSPLSRRRQFQQQQSQELSSSNQIKLPLEISRKDSIPYNQQQFPVSPQLSPQKRITNQQHKDLLIKQISYYSQPKLSQNGEYQLIQFDQKHQDQIIHQTNQQQSSIHANLILKNQQSQRRQIHFNRQSKSRKSSLSPSPSIIISQADLIPGNNNLSRQQSQPIIGSLQEIIMSKQISNDQQKDPMNQQIVVVPKMNLDKINNEGISYVEENNHNEHYSQNHRILSPTATTQTQESGVFASYQLGYLSQRTQSPSFSHQKQRSQPQFLQIPQGATSNKNSRDKYNITQLFQSQKEKKRYSRSTHTSRSISANSNFRNRFLSSHREINDEQIKMGQATPKTPHSFAGQFQASFMNSQNTGIPIKSTTGVSSTGSLNTQTQQPFDPTPFLLSVNNDIKAKEMLTQRPVFYEGYIQQSSNQSQNKITRNQKSLSAHTRARPHTANVYSAITSRSVSQHSNIQQEKSLQQNQQNSSSSNHLSIIKVAPIQVIKQSNKAENSEILNDPLKNAQIQVRKKQQFNLQKRPQSSQPYLTNRQKTYSIQNPIISTENLSLNIANFAQTQPTGEGKNFYNLNNQSEKGAASASTKSRSEYNLDNLLSSNIQQTSALQVVMHEIEFQKKYEEAMKNERKRDSSRKKNVKDILTKFKEEGEINLQFLGNASAIFDEMNKLNNQQSKRNQESSFGIKSLKKIKFSSSSIDQNKIQSHQLSYQKQTSLDKQIQEHSNQHEDSSNTSNYQDLDNSQESDGSLTKNTMVNKLKMEFQQGNQDLIDLQNEENPYKQIMQRNSKTDFAGKQKKSRFAQTSRKMIDPTPRRQSKVQIINTSSSSFINIIQDKKSSQNIIISDREILFRRNSSHHGSEIERLNYVSGNKQQAHNKNEFDNQNNFTIQEEIMSGQLNCMESPEISRKNNNLLLLLQDDNVEDKQEIQTIKMEDYSVSNYVKSNETIRHKRNNTDSLLVNPYLHSIQSNSSSQNDQNAQSLKQRNSAKESSSPIEIEESRDQQSKKWHSQKHKLKIKGNQQIEQPNDLGKTPNPKEKSQDMRTPQPSSTHNQFETINSQVIPESCTSNISQFLVNRMNLQLKVPRNLDLKRSLISFPSFNNSEIASTLSRKIGKAKYQFNQNNQSQNQIQQQNQTLMKRQSQLQQSTHLKSITNFNQSVKIQSQTLIKSNLSLNEIEENRDDKRRVVTLFKLLEETNKSYEVRDKLINSISGIIKGINISNITLSYPSIIYYILNNGVINRIRLSINYRRELNQTEEDIQSSKIDFKIKNGETRSRINSEAEVPKKPSFDKINEDEQPNEIVEVELVIQYEEYQKIYIPINLTRGLQEHAVAEHSLLITVWPLVFKEMQRYMNENHLIDINDKKFLGINDEDNQQEINIILYEDRQQIKQLINKHSTFSQINNESSDSQNLNSDVQLNSGLNKSPSLNQKQQYMNTLQNIPQLDDIEELEKSKNSLGYNLKNPKKYQTVTQFNQKNSDINLHSPFPKTSDSAVNRKLNILREQFEDLNIGFKLFGGLEQYFARYNSPDAFTVVQKRKKKILSLIDLFEIQELKDKINSFLRFSFVTTQKEIGKGFCQDFNNESYYRFYLKHLLYLKRQYMRIKAGMVEFPDEESAQPLLLTGTNLNYFYQSQSQIVQSNMNSQRFINSHIYKNRTPQVSQQSINFKVFDRPFNESKNKKNLLQKDSDTSESSLVSQKQYESFTLQNKIQDSRKVSIANSNVRKTIFINQNYQNQIQFNYFQHLKETQNFVQRVLENYLRSSPSIILSFLKKNQGQYFLIVAKLVIKQEALFNTLFTENGEFDIKDNYYFYITARYLSFNLKSRALLPPIEIQQEQLKPYFHQGEFIKGMNSQINKFIIHGKICKKQQLQLLCFLNNQIGIIHQDKLDGTTKMNKSKIVFKDTILFAQKMQAADWNSNLAQNLELYNIIYREITQKSIFDGQSPTEGFIKGYYNLFASNFSSVYQEQIKSKRVALSLFHNYDDNDTDDEKMQEQNNKYYEQFKQTTYNLPKVNNYDIEEEQTNQDVPTKVESFMKSVLPIVNQKRHSIYQELDKDDLKLSINKYYPHKVLNFLKKKREWFLNLGQVNKMRVNFSFKWDPQNNSEQFKIYLYDQIRKQKYSISQLPIKVQSILIRLIKLEEEKYSYLDIRSCRQFQISSLQNVIQFEKADLTGSKPIIKINKEMYLKNIIISSQKSIKEHLISNSSEIQKYYQQQESQFYLNMNIYGKCLGLLKFYIMRRPIFNQEQMYVFLLIIQPIKSKTKQIKFVFSFQDLIMIDTQGEITRNLKSRFTRTDMTKVIKLITSRIRMARGLFGAYPILMSEQQSNIYLEFKKENQKAKMSQQEQRQKYQNIIMQRTLNQQAQQLKVANSGQSPSSSISTQAQMVRSSRPSLFSKINSLFLKDTSTQSPVLVNPQGDQSNSRRKSIFFEQALKQQNNLEPTALSTVHSFRKETSSDDQRSFSSNSSHTSRMESITDKLSPSAKDLNESQKLNTQPKMLLSQRRPTKFNVANPITNSLQFKRPPQINLGKESILTFSQKLLDMNINITSNVNETNKITLPKKSKNNQENINSEQSQESSSPLTTPLQLFKQISPSSIDPIMNFLKTKKEVKAQINSGSTKVNQYNLTTNKDQMNKIQGSIRTTNSSQGNTKQILDPQQIIRRTESIESLELFDNKKQSNILNINQQIRNPNRKVSFVDQIEDVTETISKTSVSSVSTQQQAYQLQHGILKKAKQQDQQELTAATFSPKVHFKVQNEIQAGRNQDENPQKMLSPLTTSQRKNILKKSESIDEKINNENNKISTIAQNTNIDDGIPIQIFSPLSEKDDNDCTFSSSISPQKKIKEDDEQLNKRKEIDHQQKQEEILQKLKGQIQKQAELVNENISGSDQQNSSLSNAQNSKINKSYNQNDIIFQDLRIFKNMISRHDFSEAKSSLSQLNKGFVEAYMQKSRIIGQYVRKMANNEYVLITVKKDFILKCWDLQIYIPKTQRVLLSQISHSELIDCSYEFLNKNIASKLRFFYENKNIKPFDNYLSFLNRVNQYSTNSNTTTSQTQKQQSQNQQNISNNFIRQSKNSLLGSIISKLKNSEEMSSSQNLDQAPKLENSSPIGMKNFMPPTSQENDSSGNERKLDRKSSFTKKQIQLIKDRDQQLMKSSSIEEHIDLKEQQKLFLHNDQLAEKKSSKQDINNFNPDLAPISSNKSLNENPSPQEQLNTNYLNVPGQRSPIKKISIIKLMNVEDEDNKEGERSNKTNRSAGQKSNKSGDTYSNLAAQSDYNGDNTPKSSASSKRSIIKPLSIQNLPDSPSQLLSKMIESSMKKGQRRLTFKIGQQYVRQQSQQLQIKSANSFEELPISSHSIKKSEASGEQIQNLNEENISNFQNQQLEQPLTLQKRISRQLSKNSQETENKEEQNLIKDIVPIEQQNVDTIRQLNQNFQFIQKKTSIPSLGLQSIEESVNEEKQNNQLQKKSPLLFSVNKNRILARKESISLSNENLSSSNKMNNSSQKGKENAFQRVKRQSLFHSSSLAEDFDDNERRRSKTGAMFDQQEQPKKTMRFSPLVSFAKKPSQFGQKIQKQDNPEGGQRRNLKSLISQNQQKIVGERNLNALVDFMKPKQFEKLSLQQKMQAITEEMDLAFMTGCPNERIERLVRYIELKIWSNFLSQCEFRTDDKHFKVILFFGSSKLSVQEQLFHDYVRVDQSNESVIEIDVELQESLLFVHRDTQISTRVQLLQYFFTSFKSIPYTMTSNFSFTVQNVIINKGNIRKFNVNVRELLNLFIAEGFYRFQTNYMSSKVSYSELKNLAYFLIHKIKSSNFLELMKTQEKNVSLDKARNKNQSSSQLQSSSNLSPSKSSKNSLNSLNQLSDSKIESNTYLNPPSLFNLNGKKKQKQNFIMLKDDNMMYFYEKVINVQLRLIMRVSYFTRSHHFQVSVHKCGTTLSIIRNKSLKYFSKKIPFIQLFMKSIDLFDTALSRVCEYMKPKMILYFIIQHNLPLDQRYFSKITNTDQQKKKFSAFSSTQINFSKQLSSEDVKISDFHLDEDDDDDNDVSLGDVQESQDFEFSEKSEENEHEYFSTKNLTPLGFNKDKNILRLHLLNLQKSQYYQESQDNSQNSLNSSLEQSETSSKQNSSLNDDLNYDKNSQSSASDY